MNKFLQPFLTLIAVIVFQLNAWATLSTPTKDHWKFDICFQTANSKSQVKHELTYDSGNESIVSLNCNTPTVLTSGVAVNNNTGGGPLFYSITIPIGQSPDIIFVPTGDLILEVITNCTPPQSPIAPPYCGGATYLLKVSSPSSANFTFSLNVTALTSSSVNISFTDASGFTNNDGIVCDGANLTLTANPMVAPPTVVTGYAWSSGQVTSQITFTPATLADAGVYTVTVTDDNGCTFSSFRTVVVNTLPTASINVTETSGNTNNDSEICNTDQVTLTASGGNTYVWSSGENTAMIVKTPASTTTYTVTVTNASGCTDTEQQVITVYPLPTAVIAIAETSGSTNNDGDICLNDPITLTASGGTDYDWSSGEMTDAITPVLGVGVYIFTVTVTDANGCTDTQNVNVEVFPEPTANIVVTETSGTTNNDSNLCLDDQVTLTASGGVSYSWSTGGNTAVINDFPPVGTETYTVTVTDVNGCTKSTETTVTVFDLPIADIVVTDMSAEFDDDGLICAMENATLTADGAGPGGTYLWSNGQGSSVITVSPAVGLTTYTVTVTDVNGCTDTDVFDVEVFMIPDPMIAIAETSGLVNNDGTLCAGDDLTLTATDADPMTQFEWTLPDGTVVPGNPLNITNIDNTFNGVFIVTGDNNGCTGTETVTITVSDPPDPVEIQFEGSGANFTVCADEVFALDATVGMGSGTYTYNWLLPNGSTLSGNPISVTAIQAAHQGVWNVTVTDNFGCTGTDNIQVTVDPAPTNNSCGSAVNLGSGTTPINVSGDNSCGGTGGGCGTNSESAVYFTYTVPADGITRLTVRIDPPHVVSVSTACGGGGCASEEVIECPDKGATYYITVSSSEADEGPFGMSVAPLVETPPITGIVYIDLNASGAFDGSDIGFQGAPVELLMGCPGGAQVATTTTGADGTYTFMNIPPGSYTVQIQPGAPGAPSGDPSPKNCCLIVDPCLPDAVLECDMGYPPPNCTSNPYSVDNICQDAYDNPLCDLRVIGDFACGQNPSDLGPWLNVAHCGGVYHNTSFYGFVAGTGDYNIQITIFACAGTGVQYGLMDVCSPGGPYVICSGAANTGTITVPAESLEPCKTYVFWIDGFSASVCSYYIQVTGEFNVCEIPPVVDLTIDTDCNPLCPVLGTTLPVTAVGAPGIPALENINGVELLWDVTFPDGSTTNFVTSAQTDGLTVEVPFTVAGTYEVCVSTRHPCPGTSAPFCKTFVFEDLAPTFKEFKICTADFPWAGEVDPITGEPVLDIHGNQWAWFGGEITLALIRTSPPTFNFSSLLTNACGCAYTQSLRITEVGTSTGRDSFAICQNQIPFVYRDTTFSTNVTNLLYKLKGLKSKNGCDSLVNITTRILGMDGTIDDECVQGGLELTFNMALQYITADRDSIKYVWKNAAGAVIPDNNTNGANIIVPSVGTYTLEVSVFKFGKSCTFPFTHTIDLTGRLPLAPIADSWPQKICENDNIATYNVLAPDATLTYLWTVPATAIKVTDDSTGTLVVRWNGPTGGDICVKARNLCGDGPLTCLPVVYVDMIDPNFSLAVDVCKDNVTPIIATSTHTATPIVYNWDFDGGNSANTNGTGAGPHNVAWNSSGTKTVSLSVSENGCLGDPVTKQIEVKELPLPPIVSCAGGTSSSVTFQWTTVAGATSYNIIVVNPANVTGAIVPGQNQYQVTGLNLGQSVTIQVVAVIPGPCGNVTSLPQTCTAQDCGTLPTITISPQGPICLPGNVIDLNPSIVTVTPPIAGSSGSFTVNGTPATVFDPTALGVNTHNIQYILTWDNGRCSQSGSLPVIVRATPLSTFTVSPGGCVEDPVTITYTGGTTGATFTWNFGPDVVGTYNGPGPHQVRWTNAGAKTITLTVTKDGCTSTVTTRNVTVNPVLTSPMVTCVDQRIDGVTFGWVSVANASGYDIKVEIVGGATIFTGIVNNTTYDASGLVEGTQVRITVTALSNNGCKNTESFVICTATRCPNAKITFPAKVITECLTPTLPLIPLPFTITNNLPNDVPTVTWTSTSLGINNSTNPATLNPQQAGLGNHTLVLTYQQKDCIWKDSLLVILKPVPVASFTSLDKICITNPLIVKYTGTSTNGRVLTWDNGGGTRSDLPNNEFSYRWTTPGTYTIGLTVTLDGCVSTKFTKTIVVEDIPASPVISCVQSLDRIVFNWTAVPCATEFEVFINGVSKGKQTSRTYTASGLMEDEMVEIDVRAISTCECPIAPVVETCQAIACPKVVITLTPAQTSICLVPNVNKILVTALVTGNTPDGKGTWSGPGVDQNGNFDPAVAGLGTHVITYSYVDSTCPFEKTTSITVTQVPQIIWEAVQPKCYNDVSGSFIFSISGGTAPFTLRMDGNAVSNSPVNGVTAGSHNFTVTDANGCSSSQIFVITIPDQPSFDIKGPAIVNINKEATHTLDITGMAAFASVIDSVVWFWNGRRVCGGSLATCSSITNRPPLGANLYEVTIYYNRGCKVTDTFSYVVSDQFITTFPNIINPESKSGNTIFSITTSDPSLFVKKMRIYDRWGNLVFIAENFSAFTDPEGWNGRFGSKTKGGGQDVVPGVYVYIFEMSSDSDDNIIETGDVTVIR